MPQKNYSAYRCLNRLSRVTVGILAVAYLLCSCVPLAGTPGTASTPGSPAATSVTPAASSPAAPEAGLCRLGELSGSMTWQRSNGALSGRLVLANFGAQSCAVQGAPQIELVNENGWKLPVDQIQNSAQRRRFQPPFVLQLDPIACGA